MGATLRTEVIRSKEAARRGLIERPRIPEISAPTTAGEGASLKRRFAVVGAFPREERQGTGLEQNPLEPTIFHEPWWLELASSGNYRVAEVETGGRTVGRLPYLTSRRFGIPFIEMPMLTHFLGPALVEGEGSANNRFLKKLAITRELIQKLPAVSSIGMKLHHGVGDTVAFQEQGFRTSVQFTHEIDPLPEDILWKNLRNKTRNVIRRAEEQTRIQDLNDPGQFMDWYLQNLQARGSRSYLDRPLCEQLIGASLKRGRGRILAAYDSANQFLAASFYIWDRRSYYYLLSTRTVTSGNGTTSLLLWEGIRDASQRGLIFDSDGLNSNGGILFFAGLGGTLKPRYIVSKSGFRGQMLAKIREAVWGTNYFVRG